MATIQVPNETEATFTRTTKDGRNLRYEMKVGPSYLLPNSLLISFRSCSNRREPEPAVPVPSRLPTDARSTRLLSSS